jgi:tetratricopeptide (TPR) repeat protein
MPSAEAFPKAKEAALKALEIDEQLAEAHATLGWIEFWFDWDWEGSEKELRRALEINPNYPVAHLWYAHLLSNLGRHDEALEEMDRALKLEPLSPYFLAIKGQLLFHAHRYQEAIDHQDKALGIDPNFWIGQIVLGKNYERLGGYERALEAFRKARESSSGLTEAISLSGFTYAVSGRRGEAESVLRELKVTSKQRYVPACNIALVYQGLRNSAETLRWLERAYDERDVHMVFLGVEPKWDTLRTDPRFVSLMKRMNLPLV